MTPDLVQAIIEHLDRLHRAGQPTDPDNYLVPTAAAAGSPVTASARS